MVHLSSVRRAYIESWNEYDEGSGIYRGYTGAPYKINGNPNNDTWSSTNNPCKYIDTTANGAAGFNDTPDRDAKILWHNFPTTMQAGTSTTVHVVVRNEGDLRWTGSAGFKFGEQEFLFGTNRFLIDDASYDIPTFGGIFRGQPVTLSSTITAPTTPGTYTTHWSMFQDSVAVWRNPDVANNGNSVTAYQESVRIFRTDPM